MSILFEVVEPLHQIIQHFNRYDEDGIDRLNHKYSTIMFFILGIVVTTNLFVGEIIKCWTPAQFTEHWSEYTNSICWTSNTYYIPSSETDILTATRKEIVYYQWVPLALFFQAFLFYLPFVYWKMVNGTTGVDVNKIAQILRTVDHINPSNRESNITFIGTHLDRSFTYTRVFKHGRWTRFKNALARCGLLCGKRYGNLLVILYAVGKLLYFINTVLQLYVLNVFLGTDYTFYGVEVLRDLQTIGGYKESRRFPRVTLCDFYVRAVGKNIPYTVQCTLPINLFNEKIFIFVWLWLLSISLINFGGLVYWVWIAFGSNRRSYVKTYLKLYRLYDRQCDQHRLNDFCFNYLRQDGYFFIKMIAKNTSELTAAEIVIILWKIHERNYVEKVKKRSQV